MKRLLAFALIIFSGCVLFGDTGSYPYEITKGADNGVQVAKYRVYIVSLDDTLNTPFVDSMFYDGNLEQYFYEETVQLTGEIISENDGKWLHGVVFALSASGVYSRGTVSNFKQKEDGRMPTKPDKLDLK